MHQPAKASDPHVAVLVFPFATHAAPLLSIVSHLASSSPNAHFSFFSTAESNNSLLSTPKHYFLPNMKAYNVSNGVPDGYVFVGKPQEDIELFMKAAPENLRKAVAEAVVETKREVSCFVNDSFLWFVAEMAEELQVPFMPCWLSGSSSLSEGVLFGNLQSVFSDMLHQMGLKLRCSKPLNYGLYFRIFPESTTFSFPVTMHVDFMVQTPSIFRSEFLNIFCLEMLLHFSCLNMEASHNSSKKRAEHLTLTLLLS